MPAKKKDTRKCANPACEQDFIPWNSRQRVCGKKECKDWIRDQNSYTPNTYQVSEEFIDEIVSRYKKTGKLQFKFNQLIKV